MPPFTRTMISPAPVSGWYVAPTVALSGYPDANSAEDDLNYSEYWIDGASEPTRYAGPFQIKGNGVHTLTYRSVDKAGNVEAPKTLTVSVIDPPPLTLQMVPSILNLRTSGGLVTAAMVVLSAYSSVNAVVKAELFPTEVRALGVALPYSLANAVFGGTAEYVALAFKKAGAETSFFTYVTVVIAASLAVYVLMPDTRKASRIKED